MMLKFFHTTESNRLLFTNLLNEMAPGVPARHVVRPDLLARAIAQGGVSADLAAETRAAFLDELDADTAVLLCTCSTIGGCADQLADSRVLRVDRAMARKAAGSGSRLLVAACVSSTVEPTLAMLREESPAAAIDVLLMLDLWPIYLSGQQLAFWNAIADRIRTETDGYDAIVLAQASMHGVEHLLRELPVPVLSSPRLGLSEAIRLFAEKSHTMAAS